ncbi:MAG: DNA polymerase I [Clostridia bacterium]|nr:DNA polymerase I [Clostridia bacterium]
MNKLLLVDGYSIMYRSHFAYAGRAMLTSPDGTPTGAISGFFNSLFSVIDEYQPTHICVCFDVHAPTFRHLLSADYKATRKPMPDELRVQMPILKEILDMMGIARIEKETFEADDLIGTISLMTSEAGDEAYIYSGDHDDFQLIGDKVSVILPQSGKNKPPRVLITRDVFVEMYGIEPSSFIYVKALMGDNSDNIKGIDKVGEKTAFKLISDYHTIDELYSRLDEVKGALHNNLVGKEEHLALSLKLCTIDRHVPIDMTIGDMIYKNSKSQELFDLLNRLALKAVIKKLGMTSMKPTNVTIIADDSDETVTGLSDEITSVLSKKITVKSIDSSVASEIINAYDKLSEEDRMHPFYSIGFVNEAALIGIRGSEIVYKVDFSDLDCVFEQIISKGIKNLPASISYKTASKCLAKPISGLNSIFDVEICAYVLNLVAGTNVSFQTIYERSLGLNYPIDSTDSYAGQMSLFDTVSEEDKLVEAASDVFLCIYVAIKQNMEIVSKKLNTLLYSIEFPLVLTLDNIERNGMYVSSEELQRLHKDFSQRLELLQEDIYEKTGEKFLISSPKQLSTVLFDNLGLKHGKKGKTGTYSTSIDVLNSLIDDHPCIRPIIEYRSLSKLDSTYATGLFDKIENDGRIRTTFTQALTNTGRLSSTEPNLQNIPVRTTEGEKIRNAFVAPEGRVLVDADYSQIELRLLASMSGDEAMISAFNDGVDIHRRTAAKIFGVSEDEVTSKMRSAAKTVNFSIVYGVTEYGLSQDLGCTYSEAKSLIESYGVQFPKVMSFLNSLKKRGEELGYVDTLFGRRRNLHELSSANKNLREFGLRAAMNTPIQGTAADIIKIAMNRVRRALAKNFPDAKLVMQVHDELIVECSEADMEGCRELLKNEMEAAVELKVKLVSDCNTGKTWLEAK